MWDLASSEQQSYGAVNVTLRARYLSSPWQRLQKCPHAWVSEVTTDDVHHPPTPEDLQNISVWDEDLFEWLANRAVGRIAVIIDSTDYRPTGFRYKDDRVTLRITRITVAFSSKSLARLWALTMGGKKVDGRQMSLSLKS